MMKKLLTFLLALLVYGCAYSQGYILQEQWWIPNNTVHTILKDTATNIVYAGGRFDYWGPMQAHGTEVDLATGQPDLTMPVPNDQVSVAAGDGAGGWYIGGTFAMVGDSVRNRLAHIDASGQVTAWNPNPNNTVYSIVVSGATVYVGGGFTSIGGQSRSNLAALDAITGMATAWNPNPNSSVRDMIIIGSDVYLGGYFTNVGGQNRNRLAAVDIATGLASTWDPNCNGAVTFMSSNATTLYVAGNFNTVGGQPRLTLAAFTISTGALTAWNPTPNVVGIFDLVANGAMVYVAGNFDTIGGQPRYAVAALDGTTGNATAWNANITYGGTAAIAVSGSTVYLGGSFLTINGQDRRRIGAFDATTGALEPWTCHAGGTVRALALQGTKMYAGGEYFSIGGVPRFYLSASDGSTGLPTAWNPHLDNWVYDLSLEDSLLYTVGLFNTVGVTPKTRMACFNKNTGMLTNFNTNVTDNLYQVALDSSFVYTGGSGATQNRLFALSTAGVGVSWPTNADGPVDVLEKSGDNLYVGGLFTSLSATPRNRVASYNLNTRQLTSWDPNASGQVHAILRWGSKVYLGGHFSSIGGYQRNKLAAVDANTGIPTPWTCGANNPVLAIEKFHDKLLVGGGFFLLGGLNQNGIAELDTATGLVGTWNPDFGYSTVYELKAYTNELFVGGSIPSIAGKFRQHFAVYLNCIPPTGIANQALCDSGTVADLTAIGTNILWYDAPIGGNLLSGTTPLANGGMYYASQTVSSCESPTRFAVSVTLNSLTTLIPQANPGTTICSGNYVTLTGSGASTYAWTNGVIDGAPFSPTATATYTVTGTDTNGCTAQAPITINVVQLPNVNTTLNGSTITATLSGAIYQWLNCSNNQPIGGATGQSYTATATGNYAVAVTANGCTDTSACVSVTTVGIDNSIAGMLQVFPNPARGTAYLLLTGSDATPCRLLITDMLGRRLFLHENADLSAKFEVDLGGFAAGTYLVETLQDGLRRTVRLVVE